jgi:hypothetical protein
MADVDVWCRWIQAQLDAQWRTGGFGARELFDPVVLWNQLFTAAQGHSQSLPYGIGQQYFRGF